MWSDFFQAAVIVNIFAATIRISTPLLLAAMGELVTERSGVMNLGVEGMMIFGAFTVWLVVFWGGSTIAGVIAAMIVGASLGLLLAFLAIYPAAAKINFDEATQDRIDLEKLTVKKDQLFDFFKLFK